MNEDIDLPIRLKCLQCMRPKTSCMCKYLSPLATETHFVILMHPMEQKKVKNGTGRLTHLQLLNSQIVFGVDFSKDKIINSLLEDTHNNCYILYPGIGSLNLSGRDISIKNEVKNNVVFIIDATWPCAKKMLKLSVNLHDVQKVSFDNAAESKFLIKQQPHKLCLSTIESTLIVLDLLIADGVEKCTTENFLRPFEAMIKYQIECIKNPRNDSYRSNTSGVIPKMDRYKKKSGRKLFFDKENVQKPK